MDTQGTSHLVAILEASKAVVIEDDDISCHGGRVGIGLRADFTKTSLAIG